MHGQFEEARVNEMERKSRRQKHQIYYEMYDKKFIMVKRNTGTLKDFQYKLNPLKIWSPSHRIAPDIDLFAWSHPEYLRVNNSYNIYEESVTIFQFNRK